MSVENPSALNLDERLNRLVESTRAAAKTAEAAVEAAEVNRKAIAEAAEANRKAIVESAEVTRKSLEATAKTAEAAVESAESTRKTVVEAAESTRKTMEASVKDTEALRKTMEATAKTADADRDRLARLEKDMTKELIDSKGNRDNLARGLEDVFAASLPRAIEKTHGIVIRPEDVLVRERKNNNTKEYDFIAPNGELVLVGEVKTRLTRYNVLDFIDSLSNDFRGLFPEYAHLPVYGVVAGGVIDEDAAQLARKRGFIILRLEGGEVHPTTGKKYQPKKF